MTTPTWILGGWLALGLVSSVSCGGTDGTGFSHGGQSGASASGGSDADGSSGHSSGGATGTGGSSTGAGGASDAGDASPSGDSAAAGGSGFDAGTCANPTTYFADSDGDKYGDPITTIKACSKPPGYVENSDDCYDDNASAKPGQTGWFKVDRGDGSYDYDCNKSEVQHWTAAGNCGIGICVLTEGWQGAVPPCGTDAQYITTCGGLAICLAQATARTQECH